MDFTDLAAVGMCAAVAWDVARRYNASRYPSLEDVQSDLEAEFSALKEEMLSEVASGQERLRKEISDAAAARSLATVGKKSAPRPLRMTGARNGR